MEAQGNSTSGSLKWNKIVPSDGLHKFQGVTFWKTLLYKNYILSFGKKEGFTTENAIVLAFDLEKNEWNQVITNGESDAMSSGGFSVGYISRDKIFLYGGCSAIKKAKKEAVKDKKEDIGWGMNVAKEKIDWERVTEKKSAKKVSPISSDSEIERSVSVKKKKTKSAKKSSGVKGVLETLIIEDSISGGIFSSSREGQLLRGKWVEMLSDSILPYLQHHTANSFENKIYLVGGYQQYEDINTQIVILNPGTDNTKPFVQFKDMDSGDRYFKPRACHSSVQYRDMIYYFGGIDEEGQYLNDMWAFNPYSFQWQEIECQSLIPSPRANCMTQIVGDTIFIMGGNTEFGPCGDLLTFKTGSSTWGRKSNGLPHIKEPKIFSIYENTLIFGENFDLYSLDLGRLEKTVAGGSDDSNFRVSDRKLFSEKTYADITFNVEGQKILAHKAIVASRSSHFRNMFESGMKETNSNVIDVPEMKAETFKGFLEYLYCGELDFTEETAIDLLKLSDKFCVTGLRNLCEKFLITALKPKNALSLTSLADFCGALKLKEAGLMYMATNFDEVFDSQDIRSLPSTLIMELFKYKAK